MFDSFGTIGKRAAVMIALAGGMVLPTYASAADLLRYEFQGQPGNETSVAPVAGGTAIGLTGFNFTETSVTPATGANSINASGWNNVSATYSPTAPAYNFGFAVNAGYRATVNQIVFTARSSGTGPGTIDVYGAVDGGARAKVATFTLSGTDYLDQVLDIAPLTALQSVAISFLVDPASVQASGSGAIASGGTFRVGDYNPGAAAAATPFTLRGTIAAVTGVPEPATWAMMILGMGAIGYAMRRRSNLGRDGATLPAA